MDNAGYLINQKGERLEFSMIYANEDNEKFMTYFAETCRQAGVKVNLLLLSWATLIKRLDNYDFDTLTIGWTAVLFEDPEQLWHSKHITEPGGSNLPGYKNAQIDKLIESMPPIFDAAKRIEIIKQIDHLIYKDYPYVLFWGQNYTWLFYKNIFGMPKTIFAKYDTGDVVTYWWYDPAKVKRYQAAMKKNQALPKEPEEVYYDQAVNSGDK